MPEEIWLRPAEGLLFGLSSLVELWLIVPFFFTPDPHGASLAVIRSHPGVIVLASAVIRRTKLDYNNIVPGNVSSGLSLASQVLSGSESLLVEGTTEPFKNTYLASGGIVYRSTCQISKRSI